MDPPSNTWYLRPTWDIKPNGISIGSAVFVWIPNAGCTMHQGKKPKLPFPLGFRHPHGGGPSHGHRQHAQKLVKIARVSGYMLADRQTGTQTSLTCSSQYFAIAPSGEVNYTLLQSQMEYFLFLHVIQQQLRYPHFWSMNDYPSYVAEVACIPR